MYLIPSFSAIVLGGILMLWGYQSLDETWRARHPCQPHGPIIENQVATSTSIYAGDEPTIRLPKPRVIVVIAKDGTWTSVGVPITVTKDGNRYIIKEVMK